MLGTPTIARILQAEGVPTLREIKPQKQWLDPNVPEYYVWEPGIVMALLKNRSVIGTYTPKKAEEADPLERYYPEIIKPELFARVQELIQSRQRTGGPRGEAVSNIFSGLFRCECGSRVRYVSSNKPHVYLQCLKSYSRLLTVKKGVESAEALQLRSGSESATLDTLAKALEHALSQALITYNAWAGSSTEPTITLNRDFTASVLDPAQIKALLETYAAGVITIDTLLQRLFEGEIVADVEEEKKGLQAPEPEAAPAAR